MSVISDPRTDCLNVKEVCCVVNPDSPVLLRSDWKVTVLWLAQTLFLFSWKFGHTFWVWDASRWLLLVCGCSVFYYLLKKVGVSSHVKSKRKLVRLCIDSYSIQSCKYRRVPRKAEVRYWLCSVKHSQETILDPKEAKCLPNCLQSWSIVVCFRLQISVNCRKTVSSFYQLYKNMK